MNNKNQPRLSPTQQGPNHQWEQQLQEQRNKNYEMFGGGVILVEHGTKLMVRQQKNSKILICRIFLPQQTHENNQVSECS